LPGARGPNKVFYLGPRRLQAEVDGSEEPARWEIVEDVMRQQVTVRLYGAGTTLLPTGTSLYSSELIALTGHDEDPTQARLYNEIVYRLLEAGDETEVAASGTIHGARDAFHVDVTLQVRRNGHLFWQKSWVESIPRGLL
jgi:hypothetical protein